MKDVQETLRDTASEANAIVKEKPETSDLGAWNVSNSESEAFGTWGQAASQETKREAEDGTRRS